MAFNNVFKKVKDAIFAVVIIDKKKQVVWVLK